MYFSKTILHDLVDFAVSKGANKEFVQQKLLETALDEKHIDYEVMVKSLNFIAQELKDENLGLHIGEQVSLKVTAYVDSLMQYSPTLEKAFENAIKYSKLISDALECDLSKSEKQYTVRFEENPNWKTHQKNARIQVLNLTVISTLKSLIAYTNRKYIPIAIHFGYEKPKSLSEYYRMFNCSIKFNQPTTEIIFKKYIFENSHKKTNAGLLENLKGKVEKEIQELIIEDDTIYQLKKSILNNKPDRIKIEDAVVALNISKRTLQRKLNSLNTNFKKIEHQIQLRLLKTYLEENTKTIDEISYLLGFSESSSLIRFFKEQTGLTPIKYRKSFCNEV